MKFLNVGDPIEVVWPSDDWRPPAEQRHAQVRILSGKGFHRLLTARLALMDSDATDWAKAAEAALAEAFAALPPGADTAVTPALALELLWRAERAQFPAEADVKKSVSPSPPGGATAP